MGYAFLDTVKKYYSKGICGPFAIQCMGDAKEKLRPIDSCLDRIAGSPDIRMTPPSIYTHGRPVGYGERVAMELIDAMNQDTLCEVLS